MKKVFFKVMMIAFVAVISAGFASCSSDDAEEVSTVDVDVTIKDVDGAGPNATRAITACRNAWQWLTNHGYYSTGEVKQIAFDFAAADDADKIYAITTDELGQNPCTIPGTETFFYRVEDVKDVITLCLNNGVQGYNGPQQFAKWETGSLQGYEFKNAQGEVLYSWAGAHVIATNGYINTQHSGGEIY